MNKWATGGLRGFILCIGGMGADEPALSLNNRVCICGCIVNWYKRVQLTFDSPASACVCMCVHVCACVHVCVDVHGGMCIKCTRNGVRVIFVCVCMCMPICVSKFSLMFGVIFCCIL